MYNEKMTENQSHMRNNKVVENRDIVAEHVH